MAEVQTLQQTTLALQGKIDSLRTDIDSYNAAIQESQQRRSSAAAGKAGADIREREDNEQKRLRKLLTPVANQYDELLRQKQIYESSSSPQEASAKLSLYNRQQTQAYIRQQEIQKAEDQRKQEKRNEQIRQATVKRLQEQGKLSPNVSQVKQESIPANYLSRNAPLNTVEAARDLTFKEALKQSKTEIGRKGIKGIIPSARIILSSFTKPVENKNKQDQKTREDLLALNFGKVEFNQEEVDKAIKGYSGTAQNINVVPFSQSEKITLAATGQRSPEAVLQSISQTELRESEIIINEASVKGTNEYNSYVKNTLQPKINSGELTYEQATNLAQNKLDSINKEVKSVVDNENSRINKKVKEVVPDIKLQKAAFSVPLIVAGSFAAGAGLGLLPVAAQNVAAVGGGLYFAYETSKLGQEFITGKAGGKDVAAFGLVSAASITGFVAGAKATSGTRASIDQAKLDNAINNAQINLETKGIINEASLSKLDLPSATRAELKGKIGAGNSLRKVEVTINGRSTADQALIDKELPYRKIEYVVVQDSFGNVVDSVALGKVKLQGKTGKVFKQEIIAQSEGRILPEGNVQSETLTALSQEGKIEKALYTSETSKGQKADIKNYYVDNAGKIKAVGKKGVIEVAQKGKSAKNFVVDDFGNLIPVKRSTGKLRIVKTETGVRLIDELEARGKPLTEKQLRDFVLLNVGEGGKNVGRALSQSEFLELQRRTKLDYDIILRGQKALIYKREKLLGEGIGISTQILDIPKPKTPKRPKTPFSETFKEPKISIGERAKNIGKKISEVANQQFKDLNQIQKDIEVPVNLETGTRASVKKGAKKIAQRDPLAALEVGAAAGLTNAQINKILNSGSNLNQISQKSFNDVLAKFEQNLRFDQKQFDKQIQNQNLKVDQQLKQLQNQAPKGDFGNFAFPEIPFVTGGAGSFDTGGGALRKLYADLNKRNKRAGKYTPSLTEAFFEGKPLEVTPEQKKLLDQFEYTGAELRPLLVLKKPKKKSSSKKRKKKR